MVENITEYSYAIISVGVWILVVQILGAWNGGAKAKANLTPGGTPEQDYNLPLYRLHRAYQNSVDNLAVMTAAVVLAVLTGVSPWWVNLLASVAVVARLIMVWVHLKGIGKPAQGLRTGIYVFHWALILAIAVLAVFKVL